MGVLELTPGKPVRKDVKAQIAVELGLRAVRLAQQASYIKSARLALQNAYQSDMLWAKDIKPHPGNSPEQLRDAAIAELEEHGEPRAACARLAAQGGFWLAVHRALREAHFFADREHRDGRSPQKILEALAASPHGIHVLYRALIDGRDQQPPTSVDANGARRRTIDGKLIAMTSTWIRQDVVPTVRRASTPCSEDTFPTRQLMNRLRVLRDAVNALDDAHRQVRSVTDAAGAALVDQEGINTQTVGQINDVLSEIGRRLVIYEDIWLRRNAEVADDDALDAESPFDEIDGDILGDAPSGS